MSNEKVLKGGEFLIRETKATEVFIPEEFDEEQIFCFEFQRCGPRLSRRSTDKQ